MAVTMEVMQKVADIEVEAAGETNGFKDAFLDREPEMMMSFSDRKIQQREQVLKMRSESGSDRHAAGRPDGALASGAWPLQGDVPLGTCRRAAGAGGAVIGASKVYGCIRLS